MPNTTLALPPELAAQADNLFSSFGLTTQQAVTMLVAHCVRTQTLPFALERPSTSDTQSETDESSTASSDNPFANFYGKRMHAYREALREVSRNSQDDDTNQSESV